MHATDDVHARGAAMVARACRHGREMLRICDSAIATPICEALGADLVAASNAAWTERRDAVQRALDALRERTRSDAALARAFDEA